MDGIVTWLLALAIGLPVIGVLVWLAAAARLARLRWRRTALGLAAPGAVPPGVRATLDAARPVLRSLGFEFRYTTACEPVQVADPRPLVINDVYQHLDQRTHAIVTTQPGDDQAWTALWVSQLRSGHVLATVNDYLHHLVSAPSGWLMEDGYLPDARASWQRHLERLPTNELAIVTDGVEFFHTNKQAVDGFIAQCEKRGLLAQRGEHWQLRFPAAVAWAWRRFVARRKAAGARGRKLKDAPAPGS